jgi:hypothetical protein
MARIQVPAARATFSESSEGLLITIPANKNWFAILFLGFWLAIWLSGEVSVSRELIPGHSINRAHPRPHGEFGEQLFLVAWARIVVGRRRNRRHFIAVESCWCRESAARSFDLDNQAGGLGYRSHQGIRASKYE